MSGNKARHHENHQLIKCRISRVQTFFADLVVLAEEFHPIPFRTRPLKPPAPMVLRPKPRESRSLPGLRRTFANPRQHNQKPRESNLAGFFLAARLILTKGNASTPRTPPTTPGKLAASSRFLSRDARAISTCSPCRLRLRLQMLHFCMPA